MEFRASLNRHTAPVNVVRFSPVSSKLASAGDDGVIIIWRQQPTDSTKQDKTTAAGSEEFGEPETWRPVAMLRGSLADICDLAWSPDGKFLVSASVDNTARIWDVREARCIQVLANHTHYVQGVAWDPLGEFIVTQSSDRSMRVYRWTASKGIKAGQPVVSLIATHHTMPIKSNDDMEVDEEGNTNTVARKRYQRLFYDDNLASFFRRPSISPDGRLVATAAGIQRANADAADQSSNHAAAAAAAARSNTCYVWARDQMLDSPVLSLSGHAKPVVATRWAPCRFEARPENAGWLEDSKRMMLAVASQGAVSVYDTSVNGRAIGFMNGLHYAAITDLSWTQDGSHLVIVSIDGFASVAAMDGQPTPAIPPETVIAGSEDDNNQTTMADNETKILVQPSASNSSSVAKNGKKRLAPMLVSQI